MQQLFYLGIDVSKKSLSAALVDDANHCVWHNTSLANDESGFKRLNDMALEHAGKKSRDCSAGFKILVGLEPTGVYGEKLSTYFHECGFGVYVLSPHAVRSYADAFKYVNKNDKADAQLIAAYLETAIAKKKAWLFQPLCKEERVLRELSRRRDTLVKQRSAEKNRLEKIRHADYFPDCVARNMTSHMAQLDDLIHDVEREMETLIRANGDLAFVKRLELLQTLPGVGKIISVVIESETRGVTPFKSKKALVDFAGIAPGEHASGSSVRRRTKIDRRGSSRLRHALYLAVLSAINHNPVIKDYYIKLQERGKKKKVALVACMRKLLHIIWSMCHNERPFDALYGR